MKRLKFALFLSLSFLSIYLNGQSLEEEKEEMKYVTKEEFTSAVEEIKAMIDEKFGDKEEMKEEVIKDTKEELSAVAPEPVKHNPEAEVDNKVNFHIASNRTATTKDRVFDKIFNNN